MTAMDGSLGITSSYEEWLDEFIMINSDPARSDNSGAGSPLTRREYYATYCGPDVDPKNVYEQHLAADRENRLRGAIAETPADDADRPAAGGDAQDRNP
ncbi:MAG: hypothetical protein J4F28_03640 [Nitrosopumilaceae archaeon]|nr:hypothetical protein [Nitrosopumilaceae archaeon]